MIDRIEAAANEGEWQVVGELLSSLDDEGMAAGRRWWNKGGRAIARRVSEEGGRDKPESWDGMATARLLAIVLAPSAERTVASFQWSSWASVKSRENHFAVVAALLRQGAEWCAEFTEAASHARLPGWDDTSTLVVSTSMPLIAHFGLPLPTGPRYIEQWSRYYAHTSSSATSTWLAARPESEYAFYREFRLDPSGKPSHSSIHLSELRLSDVLCRDPQLRASLSATIGEPRRIGAFVNANPGAGLGWSLREAIPELLEIGALDRESLISDCLEAATRRDSAAAQRGLAQVLEGTRLRPDDVRDRLPLVLGILATVHGSLTGVLLPTILGAIDGEGDLVELATIIFGRTEKKQQTELLAALCGEQASDRYGREGVVRALELATVHDDLRLAGRARSALSGLGRGPEEPNSIVMTELWHLVPQTTAAESHVPTEPTLAGITQLLSELGVQQRVTDHDRLLESLVAFAYEDSTATREWLTTLATRWDVPSPIRLATDRWIWGTHRDDQELATAIDFRSGRRPWPDNRWATAAPAALRGLLETETVERLGTIPGLLSTPTDNTGVVRFDDLLDRIRRFQGVGYGQLDLLQALLRLEPVEPARADELKGLRMPDRSPVRHALPRGLGHRRGPDGVDLVRQWILTSGATFPGVDPGTSTGSRRVAGRRGLTVPETIMPIRTPTFAPYLDALFGTLPGPNRRTWGDPLATIAVLPHSTGLQARELESQLIGSKMAVPAISAIVQAGPAGPDVHRVLARVASHPDAASRLIGVDATLVLMGRGAFDPELFAGSISQLFAAGELPLARTSDAFEQIMLAGGMRQLWPVVLRLADDACRVERRSPGTAELLSLIRRLGSAVPQPVVPDAVRSLAGGRGTAKAEVEARALVGEFTSRAGATR